MPLSPDLLNDPAFEALTTWWEDAGVEVDRRALRKMLSATGKANVREPHVESRTEVAQPAARRTAEKSDPVVLAKGLAAKATTLDMLRETVCAFQDCPLVTGATQAVFADGSADADIMVIGEGPGREEDETGKPFVGRAGQLLDKMLASIGLSRETNTYITNVNFWRPPGNRNPTEDVLAICRPFVDRHIALKRPKLIIAAGAVPANALLGVSDGIRRLRGQKKRLDVPGLDAPVPLIPIYHPAYLLRVPAEKAKAWDDLRMILSMLTEMGIAPEKHL